MTKDLKIMLVVVGVAVTVLLGLFAFGRQTTKPAITQPQVGDLVPAGSHRLGSGPIMIVEFADFQCPACRVADADIKRFVKDNANKVTLVFRHLPLPQHANAIPAARAAEAAGRQGKFWEMGSLLYQNQSSWLETTNPEALFVKLAGELGLDSEKFAQDYADNQLTTLVERDRDTASRLGIGSTPTVIIDGRPLGKFPSYDNLQAKLSQLMGG